MESSDDYTKEWALVIRRHKRILLPWYRSRVFFPQAPYSSKKIEAYVSSVRPYLKRSKQFRLYAKILTVVSFVSCVSYWQYGLHLDAKALEAHAVALGWELNIGPPYTGVVSESRANVEWANSLSERLGRPPAYPWTDESLSQIDSVLDQTRSVSVSGGSFMMGCVPGDGNCAEREKPRHKVTISHDMEVMTTEVTQGLYITIMGSNPSLFTRCGLDCPVEEVSWYDAIEFSNALNRTLGLEVCYTKMGDAVSWSNLDCNGWRLPTESEWEYLARGGEEHHYAGSNSLGSIAWYDGNSGGETHPVGQKVANGFGLVDMSGNVSEWCWDWNGDYSSAFVTDPRGPSIGSYRVRRGGSWNNLSNSTGLSFRSSIAPSFSISSLGFRLLKKI